MVGLVADVAGWGDASTAPRLAQVTSQTHTKWLREQFLWSTIEPTRGSFDFTYYDHFMQIAAQNGMHILGLLTGASPSWSGVSGDTLPPTASDYAGYVAAVIARYGTNGTFWQQYPTLKGSAITTWELWNEPYYATNYDPARYATMVKAAATAGRAKDPNAKFLLGAEMQSARNANGDWVWWVDALYNTIPDLNSYFDGIAVHPYGDTLALTPQLAGQPYQNYDHMLRILDIRQEFLNHNAANKPFWITEAGWSTCTDGNTYCVSQSTQAANLSTLFGYVRGSWSSWVQAAFIYRYQDDSDTTNIQNAYGLVNADGTAKPALSVFLQQVANSA